MSKSLSSVGGATGVSDEKLPPTISIINGPHLGDVKQKGPAGDAAAADIAGGGAVKGKQPISSSEDEV
jgi:hypothetical protein